MKAGFFLLTVSLCLLLEVVTSQNTTTAPAANYTTTTPAGNYTTTRSNATTHALTTGALAIANTGQSTNNNPSVNVFLIVMPLVVLVVCVIFNIQVINYFLDPMDKYMAYFQKIVVVVGLTFTEIVILLLPLDAANKSGLVGCGTWNALCGGLPMAQIWEAVFIIIFILIIAIIPYAIFYYESDDGITTKNVSSRHCEALKYTLCLVVILVAFFLILFGIFIGVLGWKSRVPVVAIGVSLNATVQGQPAFSKIFTVYNASQLIPDVLPASYQACNVNLLGCKVDPNSKLVLDVTFIIFLIASFGFIGWILFMVYGGIGLFALPVDLINAFLTRPKYLPASKYSSLQVAIDKRLVELIEIGEKIEEEIEHTKTLRGGERRRQRRLDQATIRKFQQAVYFIEKDYEDLRLCHKEYSKYNPLIPFAQLILGAVAIILSVLFMLQVALYIIPIQYTGTPISLFLNGYFIWFDSWFPAFGTISVAIFAMYLLLAVIKGTFKFGMRFFLLPIHPMKVGGTMMNSFLFNLILVLLCAIPTCQFCSQAFADYIRLTDIDVIFQGQIQYMDGFTYFYAYNVFIYGLVLFSLITIVWLIMCPGNDKLPENELRAIMLDEEARERRDKDRADARALRFRGGV